MIIDLFLEAGDIIPWLFFLPFIFGGSSSQSETGLEVKSAPGAFGGPGFGASGRLATNLESLLGTAPAQPGQVGATAGFETPADVGAIAGSPFAQPLEQALLSPEFGPTTASEQALLGSLAEQVGGRSAVRGLGSPTELALTQALAPALIGLRQQGIGNLQTALQQDLTSQLTGRGQDVTQRGQTMSSLLGQAGLATTERGQDVTQRAQDLAQALGLRQQDIEGLLELIGLAMPQIIAGQTGTSKSLGVSPIPIPT